MAKRESGEVIIKSKEVVAPEKTVKEHVLALCSLDFLQERVYPSTFFCFKKPLDDKFTFQYMVSLLKKSLAQALVTYYPLAGEIRENIAGEPEIVCNSRGVDFVEAFADVELKDLNFYLPDECIGGKLVPELGLTALHAVQVTELKCGGIVVVGTFDHRFLDAYSSYKFFVTWGEAAQGKPPSQKPVFSRALLNPRNPGSYDSSIEEQYMLAKDCKTSSTINTLHPEKGFCKISRTYYVESDKINELQSLANKRTKIEVFCAFIWKLIASLADKTSTKKMNCKLGILADGRARISGGDENKAKLLAAYHGNVNTIPYGEKSCEELIEKPLSWVADEVHSFLEIVKKEEFYLGLIDWLEAHRPEKAIPRICATVMKEEGPAIIVSSSLRFPIDNIEFGWGHSAFASYYFPPGGELGCVVLLPSPRNGDWILYNHMIKEQIDFIESEAAHIIRPITSSYLNLA